MATSLASALDSATDTIDDQNVPALPQGQAFTGVYVYDSVGDMTYLASLAQVRASLAAPNPLVNQKPIVSLTVQPTAGAVGQQLVLTATATDPDGQIVGGVAFFLNGQPIGTIPASPYVLPYTPTTPGTAIFSVVATDNAGDSTTATAPAITITAAPPLASTITFASPGNKTVGDAPFQLTATSTNASAPITFSSANSGVVSVSGTTATVVGAGTVILTASQAAGNGYAAGSATRSVTVAPQSGQAPTVALEINPQSMALGSTAQLFAAPSSQNSTIASVAFFDGTTQIGQPVTSAPWQASYTPTAAGTHPLTAKATDALGVVSAASNVQNLVVSGPTVFTQTLDPNGVNARDTLTYDPQSQGVVGYNNPVQTSASGPGSYTMYVCYPNAQTIIGQLDFDPLDAGHLCEVVLNGTRYRHDALTSTPLSFTNGNVLLAL